MSATLGYNQPLFILAFDHRASFSRDLLGLTGSLSAVAEDKIRELKQLIFKGFELVIKSGLVPKNQAAILIDEQFGESVIRQATQGGYQFCLSVETSGQPEFVLEYGSDWAEHIEKFKPTFVKALVRYNVASDRDTNNRQLEKLNSLSCWCHKQGYKLLIELLVPASLEQLAQVDGQLPRYDKELRPGLTVAAVEELQTSGVAADLWKIEGMDEAKNYQAVINTIKSQGRANVNMVVLGRGENSEHMANWLRAAKGVKGIIGFAIGRTIFWEPLKSFLGGELTGAQASQQVADNYHHFYQIFTQS